MLPSFPVSGLLRIVPQGEIFCPTPHTIVGDLRLGALCFVDDAFISRCKRDQWVSQSLSMSPDDKVHPVTDAEFGEDMPYVCFDGDVRDGQLLGDLWVGVPGDHEVEHVSLALGECCQCSGARSRFRLLCCESGQQAFPCARRGGECPVMGRADRINELARSAVFEMNPMAPALSILMA